jgi:hypothetical protein
MASFSTTFTGSENPLSESGVFESVSGWAAMQKVSGNAEAAATITHAVARYIGTSFGDNQYSWVTNANDSNANSTFITACTRLDHSNGAGYYLVYKPSANQLLFFRADGGPATLLNIQTWSITPTANAAIKLVSRGIRHEVWFNDVRKGVIWDDTYHGGQPGFHIYADGAVGNTTIGDWECGDDEIPDTFYTTFTGTENPLSESGAWNAILADTSLPFQRWWGGLQKGDVGINHNVAFGTGGTGHFGSFLTRSFTDDQYAAVAATSGIWAGVITRCQSNVGECYLALYLQNADANDPVDPTSPNLVRLYCYDKTNSSSLEGYFHVLARAAPVQTIGSFVLLELESKGNRHKVYIRSVSGQTEQDRELVIDYDASSDSRIYHNGAPGCAATSNGNPIYDFWCDQPRDYPYVGSGGLIFGGAAATSGPYPPHPVLQVVPTWPMLHSLRLETVVCDMGDGFEQRINFNSAYTRADGEGGISSYAGRNIFQLKFTTLDYAQDAATLWNFYLARGGSLEPFYVYNIPDEVAAIDETGWEQHGRYLVRFQDNALSREKFMLKLYNAELTLIEVRA